MNIFCDICLNFDRIYPQQNITGSVAATASKKCTITQIIIEITGKASCRWQYDKPLVKFFKIYKKKRIFSGSDEFFISRHTLAGGNAGSATLSSALQIFPFKCSLPEYLPATWSGRYGKIQYMAKVMMKEENKPLYIFTKEINVYPRRNLKLEQHLLCEARQDVHRHFRYAVISLGTVELSIWLPLCGIAAGQGLPILCTIKNGSAIKFGGLIFVLTQIEIYRSEKPTAAVKTSRKDICRIPRMVDILSGKYEYYCVIETDPDIPPTNQFHRCKCCQVTYEVWVSLQGAIPRYNAYGYPNIDTPGIPIIVGTEPLCKWNCNEITNDVMDCLYSVRPPMELEFLPPDDEVEEMLNIADEELDIETENNLVQQLVDKSLFIPEAEDDSISGVSIVEFIRDEDSFDDEHNENDENEIQESLVSSNS